MQQSWNHTSPPHSVEIEHRLTVVEIEAESHRKQTARKLGQHGRRITALETKQPQGQRWTPRDYLMASAGIAMVVAALAEKIGWTTAVAGLLKLYGVR